MRTNLSASRIAFVMAAAAAGCQTSGPKIVQNVPLVYHSEAFKEFSFSQTEAKSLYGLMSELAKTPDTVQDSQMFYSLEGSIECQQQGALQSCYLRAGASDSSQLSERKRLDSELAARLIEFFTFKRATIFTQDLALAYLRCDRQSAAITVSKTSETKCHLDHPHWSHEAVFEDYVAEHVFHKLHGRNPEGTKVAATGDFLCETMTCYVRVRTAPPDGATLSLSSLPIKPQPLDAETSNDLVKKLTRTRDEHLALMSGTNQSVPDKNPAFQGTLNCESALISTKSGNVRKYICTAALQL